MIWEINLLIQNKGNYLILNNRIYFSVVSWTKRARGNTKGISYDNVKLNYTLVAVCSREWRHTWHSCRAASPMHNAYDILWRLDATVSSCLQFATCYEFSRRAASICEIERTGGCGPHLHEFPVAWPPSTVTNRTTNIGNLEGNMRNLLHRRRDKTRWDRRLHRETFFRWIETSLKAWSMCDSCSSIIFKYI